MFYQRIIHFEELKEGQTFASTKSGKHYRKLSTSIQRLADQDYRDPSSEMFDDPKALVYVDVNNERAIICF